MKKFIIILLITFAIGGIPSLISGTSVEGLITPPLFPPKILFPIVWSILYVLLTISCYRATKNNDEPYVIYFIQMILNGLWTPIFFGLKLRLLAFFWLIALLISVIIMTIKFYKEDKLSGLLQIPYILWLSFAGYINLAIYLLNK